LTLDVDDLTHEARRLGHGDAVEGGGAPQDGRDDPAAQGVRHGRVRSRDLTAAVDDEDTSAGGLENRGGRPRQGDVTRVVAPRRDQPGGDEVDDLRTLDVDKPCGEAHADDPTV